MTDKTLKEKLKNATLKITVIQDSIFDPSGEMQRLLADPNIPMNDIYEEGVEKALQKELAEARQKFMKEHTRNLKKCKDEQEHYRESTRASHSWNSIEHLIRSKYRIPDREYY